MTTRPLSRLLLWCSNRASSSANALSLVDIFYTFIAITKAKIILYKACKCDSSIAIGVYRVVTLAYIQGLQNQYGIRNILKPCQELHFNYCIRYSLQICRAYRYRGAPFQLQYGTSIFNMKLQPKSPNPQHKFQQTKHNARWRRWRPEIGGQCRSSRRADHL